MKKKHLRIAVFALALIVNINALMAQNQVFLDSLSNEICACINKKNLSEENVVHCLKSAQVQYSINEELLVPLTKNLYLNCEILSQFLSDQSASSIDGSERSTMFFSNGFYEFKIDDELYGCVEISDSNYRELDQCEITVAEYKIIYIDSITFKLKKVWISEIYNFEDEKQILYYKIEKVSTNSEYLVSENYANGDKKFFVLSKR